MNISDVILEDFGISKETINVAKKVYNLKEKDQNVREIEFSRHRNLNNGGGLYLVANIELTNPFKNIKEFQRYLKEHKITYDDTISEENSFEFSREIPNSDGIMGKFYQPHWLKEEMKKITS